MIKGIFYYVYLTRKREKAFLLTYTSLIIVYIGLILKAEFFSVNNGAIEYLEGLKIFVFIFPIVSLINGFSKDIEGKYDEILIPKINKKWKLLLGYFPITLSLTILPILVLLIVKVLNNGITHEVIFQLKMQLSILSVIYGYSFFLSTFLPGNLYIGGVLILTMGLPLSGLPNTLLQILLPDKFVFRIILTFILIFLSFILSFIIDFDIKLQKNK